MMNLEEIDAHRYRLLAGGNLRRRHGASNREQEGHFVQAMNLKHWISIPADSSLPLVSLNPSPQIHAKSSSSCGID